MIASFVDSSATKEQVRVGVMFRLDGANGQGRPVSSPQFQTRSFARLTVWALAVGGTRRGKPVTASPTAC
jgi:hypothetical protein